MTKNLLLLRIGGAVAALVAVLALVAAGHPGVTRPRLEKALNAQFTNLYLQQAKILGHSNVTAASIGASTSCDRGGPRVKDVGAGPDWICHILWTDDKGAQQDGKFEVAAKANYCYVAGGPSKIVGLITIPDARGRDVLNPLFEFDGCYAPA